MRAELHRRGLRFRKDHFLPIRGARGVRVDIAFIRAGVAVFIDGCFWHGCPDHGHAPRRNTDYWGPKLARNRARDKLVTEQLVEDGWRVVRVWEHTPPGEAADLVAAIVVPSLQRR